MYTVYVVTNAVNGKMYVGQTKKTGLKRLQGHFNTLNKKLIFHSAILKHGKENFSVVEVGHYEKQQEVCQAERLWILLLRTWHRGTGYNATFGGESSFVHTEETRKRISESKKGTLLSEATKQKMSEVRMGEKNHFFGKTHKPETIAAMVEKLKVSHSGEGNYWFGKTFTPEHLANMSKAQLGKKKTTTMSEEGRKKLSEAATARWAAQKANPDSSRSIGKPRSPRSKPMAA